MRVLLVEDDVILAQTICEALEGEGFHVDEADRGEDGLELADLYEYQVMVLDLGLPDMRGDEVLQNLRQKKPQNAGVDFIRRSGSRKTAVLP